MPAALEIPVGEQMQRPHAFSAVKVGGERLYKKARRGELVEAPPRPIEVYRSELLWHDGERAEFVLECSSGTYVRQLVADLGDAYCEELERTAIGAVPARGGRRRTAERPIAEASRACRGRSSRSGRRACCCSRWGTCRRERRPAARPRPRQRERRVAIGTFDGVHVGHREVIRGCDTVLTFDPHPLSVVRPEAAPKLITPFNVKRDIIAGLGVEELVVIPFDEDFRETSAEQFVEEILVEKLGAVAGLGRRELPLRQGRQGRRRDAARPRSEFETRVAPLVEVDGETVSSTPDPRAGRGRRRRARPRACSAGRSSSRARSSHGDKRGRELGHADREPDPGRARSCIPGTASTRPGRTGTRPP